MNNDIIQHIEREQTATEIGAQLGTLTLSSISALPQVTDLNDGDLFEISELTEVLVGESYYTSKCVAWSTILKKVQESSSGAVDAKYLEARFGTLKNLFTGITDQVVLTVWKYLNDNWEDVLRRGIPNLFGESDTLAGRTPYVWADVWALACGEIMLNKYLKKLDDRVKTLEYQTLAFGSEMEFNTTLSTYQDDGSITRSINRQETMVAAYHNAASGVNSNGFVMAFFNENKLSNVFTCPKNGILTLYGWIDSSNVTNSKYLPTAWCALKGEMKMNGSSESTWEIMQVQPVVPAKQFSYVSFCVPVVAGLKVQLELGFPPGPASGRYDRGKIPESLANVQPNAFLGGVFSQTMPS